MRRTVNTPVSVGDTGNIGGGINFQQIDIYDDSAWFGKQWAEH